jgi:porphobilinogen deaminase
MIRLLSRDSLLALSQTTNILFQLKQKNLEAMVITRKTKGDLNLSDPLYSMPEKGSAQAKAIFIKELEEGLIQNEGDVAVHSLKDLPTQLPENLELSHICLEEDDRDLIIAKRPLDIEAIANLNVGTSSLRRIEQLKDYMPRATFKNLRGNVITRLEKLISSDEYDIIVLAAAGIKRLLLTELQMQDPNFLALLSEPVKATMLKDLNRMDKLKDENLFFYLLDSQCCLPAVSQGKLGLEIKKGKSNLKKDLDEAFSQDKRNMREATTLRKLLNITEAGCHAAFGAKITNERLDLYYKSNERTFRGHRSLSHGLKPIIQELSNYEFYILWAGNKPDFFGPGPTRFMHLELYETTFLNPKLPRSTRSLIVSSKTILDFYDHCPINADIILAPGKGTAAAISSKWNRSVNFPKTGLGIDYIISEHLISPKEETIVLGSKKTGPIDFLEYLKVYENKPLTKVKKPKLPKDTQAILALTSPIAVNSAYKNQILDNFYLAVYGEKANKLLESYGKKAYIYNATGTLNDFMDNIKFSSSPEPLRWEQSNWETL